MVSIKFAAATLPTEGALVLLMMEGATIGGSGPTGLWQQADAACGGGSRSGRAIAAAEFTGKKAQTAMILAPGAGLSRVLLVGLGKPADHTTRGMEEAGGNAAAALAKETAVHIAADGMPASHAAHAGLGAAAPELSVRPLSNQGGGGCQAEARDADAADGRCRRGRGRMAGAGGDRAGHDDRA